MKDRTKSKFQWRWVVVIMLIGVAFMLYACEQQAGQSSLANKPPPNLGAIAEVDGSEDTKKAEKKPEAGAQQAPAQAPAGSQPAQPAPKQ